MGMVRMTNVAVDVTLNGWKTTLTGLAGVETAATRLQKRLDGNKDTLLKVAAGMFLLTSASVIAGVYLSALGSAFGYIIDTALTPFMPLMDLVIEALHAFGDWLDTQGPFVKAMFLGIALAVALMWLGVSGPAALAIGALVGLGLWASTEGPVIQTAMFGIAAAAAFMWLATLGPIAYALILLGLPVAAFVAIGAGLATLAFLVVKHWDTIKEAFRSSIDAIMGWLRPLMDAVGLLGDKLDFMGRKSGFGSTQGLKIPGLANGGLVTRPTLAMVGEAGPELVVPLNRPGGGRAGDIMHDNSLGPITVNVGQGGGAAGRDAAIALQSHLALRGRV